ncbi:hypothetical protein BDZ91DRAFT_758203 [Kalaharituber pfeilii]|nr:hypothetical protein BDZ91DRAFT_758203 [Kalaharituber pfeilii]
MRMWKSFPRLGHFLDVSWDRVIAICQVVTSASASGGDSKYYWKYGSAFWTCYQYKWYVHYIHSPDLEEIKAMIEKQNEMSIFISRVTSDQYQDLTYYFDLKRETVVFDMFSASKQVQEFP